MNLSKKYDYTLDLNPNTVLDSLSNLTQLVFEVTSQCNLKCTYCGYGELYNEKRRENDNKLDFRTAKKLIDYLASFWKDGTGKYQKNRMVVSFYGGEPLLNFSLIEKIIAYLDDMSQDINKRIDYAMTTNAMLLDKYMDFLADKKFKLLISLDGNEIAHSYRVDYAGKNSFDRVIKNVELLKNTYPTYFEKYVDFNSVLTNRTTYYSVRQFIFNKFGKYPTITEINNNGILPGKRKNFNSIYRNVANDLNSETTPLEIDFHKSPNVKQAYRFLRNLGDNSYNSYDDLLRETETINKWLITGTCLPFSRKLYLTSSGDILPCEKIDHKYTIGKVTPDDIDLNIEKIASIYSNHYKRLWNHQCRYCASKPTCMECMFYIEDLDTTPKCPQYKNKKQQLAYIQRNLNYIADNPDIYEKIMKEFF